MSKKTKTPANDGASKIDSVNPENQDEQTPDCQELSDEQTLDSPESNNPENEQADAVTSSDSDADSSANDNPSDASDLKTTGEISLDGEFVDTMVLSRLRAKILSLSEIYQEAQLFSAQNLNVPELLTSGEPVLTQNLIEILRILDLWYDEAVALILTDNDSLFESVSRYIIQSFKNGIVQVNALLEDLMALEPKKNAHLSQFAERFSSVIISAVDQRKSDIPVLQNALTRICAILDKNTISRLLYDPSPIIRIALIRYFQNCDTLEINVLSVALILLKDKNDAVNIALMRLLAKHTPYPELVIPQILAAMNGASDALRQEILDVLRNYDNDAVDPVMHAIESIQPGVFEAVREAISQCPQRYTRSLLKALSSCRSSDLVKNRIADILRKHKDPTQTEEIQQTLKVYLAPEFEEPPKWVQPNEDNQFAQPVTDKKLIYEKVLSKEELLPLIPEFTDEMIGNLLADASETVIINALNLMKYAGRASDTNIERARVWLKSTSMSLATAAIDTYLTLEPDVDKASLAIVDAFQHGESDEVKKYFFNIIMTHQEKVDGIIHAFYKTPRKCVSFIHKFLALNPNKQTIDEILKGLDRTQSVACISETLQCLLRTKFAYDNHPVRPLLISLLTDPVSFGQFGLMTRLFALRLLRKYLLADETPDRETIAALQAFHKDGKNAELRLMAKELLRDLGEEIFDLDDEEDDFDDLEDEEDDI
ncbi:MAG: hypothetical protein IJU23_10715 [Proteobacteria bacterium]|nr:hypothetical protein [Pseudomonadota bacterium]